MSNLLKIEEIKQLKERVMWAVDDAYAVTCLLEILAEDLIKRLEDEDSENG